MKKNHNHLQDLSAEIEAILAINKGQHLRKSSKAKAKPSTQRWTRPPTTHNAPKHRPGWTNKQASTSNQWVTKPKKQLKQLNHSKKLEPCPSVGGRNNGRHRKAHKLNYANVNRIRLAVGKPRLATDPSGNVVNLTKHSFSIPEYNLLGKNLNFCPTTGNFNSTTLQTDINNFTRKIKLRAHFGTTKEDENNKKEFYIKNKNSTWTPNKTHHTIKTFIEAFQNEIENLPKNNTQRKYNLTKDEREALEKFQQRDDIIITNADKGGAIVIQDVEKYIEEANRQLHDETFSKKMRHWPDPKTQQFNQPHHRLFQKLVSHWWTNFENATYWPKNTKILRSTKNP